jgi:hypothetical protein
MQNLRAAEAGNYQVLREYCGHVVFFYYIAAGHVSLSTPASGYTSDLFGLFNL